MSEPPKDVEVIDLTLSDASESEDEEELEEQLQQRSDSPGGDSDASEIEITLDQTTRSQLQNAIANVSETRLRDIISRLVQTELALEICLTRELVTIKRGSQEVVQRWEVCRHCDDEYDINTAREDDECIFHPGPSICSAREWETHGKLQDKSNMMKTCSLTGMNLLMGQWTLQKIVCKCQNDLFGLAATKS